MNKFVKSLTAQKLGFVLLLAMSPLAHASWKVGSGVEQFNWHEYASNGSLLDKEQGARYDLFASYLQNGNEGLLFGWHGKFYTGDPTYNGATQLGVPYNSDSQYNGLNNELLAVYRTRLDSKRVDWTTGLGYDMWRRGTRNTLLGMTQNEDWNVVYAKFGGEIYQHAHSGWHGGGGVRYTLYTSENSHFDALGASSNPSLSPGKSYGYDVNGGYRINRHWDFTAYYSYTRFTQSSPVSLSFGGLAASAFQPLSVQKDIGANISYQF
ncbi:MAG: hypothetical protein KGI54_05915 [Pseudomonadota bacterium]|nr:hypothetical protein [Pseudomonadota bacterium]